MKAEQAWQSVLEQLKADMPRSSFQTWVSDACFISYDEGVMTIGARNQYGRDWLKDRLTDTVANLLTGIMDRTVEVRFIIANEANDIQTDDFVSETDEQEEEYVQVAGIDPLNDELSEEELQMLGRELVVSGYTRRHVPESGVKEMLFYACMRQAFYWAGETKRDGITNELRITTADLIRWSVFPRSTWFRQIEKFNWEQDMAGLVERNIRTLDGKKKYDYQYYKVGNETRRRRLPNKYRVYISPRLTRADAAHIFIHLAERAKQTGLLSAIEELIQMNRKDLLAFLPPLGAKAPKNIPGLQKMFYVTDIVKTLTGIEGELPQELKKAAISLNKTIIKLFGTMHVNHYFLYQLAPASQLTPHQIWLNICACDDSYNNQASGEYRDEVIYSYADLTSMCGMAETSWKNIRAWLHPNQYPKLVRGGDLSLFLRELPPSQTTIKLYGNEKDMKRKFQVRLSFEDIHIPKQQQATKSDSNGTYRPIQMGLTRADSNETYIEDSSETYKPIQVRLTKSDSSETHSPDSNGTKNLKSLLAPESQNKIIAPTTNHAENAKEGGWGIKSRWNLKTIFEINRVNPKIRQELANKDVRDLVSWVLWAASPEGDKNEPFNFALAQLKTFVESSGAGGLFDQLAKDLTPDEIFNLISETPLNAQQYLSSRQKEHCQMPYGIEWRRIMVDGKGYNEKIEKVRLALFGTSGENMFHSKKIASNR